MSCPRPHSRQRRTNVMAAALPRPRSLSTHTPLLPPRPQLCTALHKRWPEGRRSCELLSFSQTPPRTFPHFLQKDSSFFFQLENLPLLEFNCWYEKASFWLTLLIPSGQQASRGEATSGGGRQSWSQPRARIPGEQDPRTAACGLGVIPSPARPPRHGAAATPCIFD